MDIEPKSPPNSLISRENIGSLRENGHKLEAVRLRQVFSPLLCDVEMPLETTIDLDVSLVATSNAEPGYDKLSLHRKAEAEGRRIRGLEPLPEFESM
jgi:hypothetical protein